jgi:hypothetical protein
LQPAEERPLGIDYLDFTFRIEKRFGIQIQIDEHRMLDSAWMSRRPPDVTAGELHGWVVKLCEARGLVVPYSSWNGVRLELAKTLGKPPQVIHRDTLVVRDLGLG